MYIVPAVILSKEKALQGTKVAKKYGKHYGKRLYMGVLGLLVRHYAKSFSK